MSKYNSLKDVIDNLLWTTSLDKEYTKYLSKRFVQEIEDYLSNLPDNS